MDVVNINTHSLCSHREALQYKSRNEKFEKFVFDAALLYFSVSLGDADEGYLQFLLAQSYW